MPLAWDEVRAARPEEFTVATATERFAASGDPWAGMADSPGELDGLLRLADDLGPPERPPKGEGRRQPTKPLIEIARAKTKPEAIEALEKWKARHKAAAAHLEPADVLVDGMRGRSSLWYRIRINLEHVPETLRPKQEKLELDYDPWAGAEWAER